MAHVDSIRSAFVSLWGSMGPFWGVSSMAARVYGWLLSKESKSTADEIMDGLSMSRGAVSMACRELRDWGLIHADREPGSRQIAYRAETDLERALRNIVQTRKRREWDPILHHLREWIPKLEAERSAEAAVFRERLAAIESLVSTADSMAESFLKGGMVQRFGLKVLIGAAEKKARARRKKA